MNTKILKTATAITISAILAGSALAAPTHTNQGSSTMNHAQNPNLPTSMVSNWDKTFPKSNKVNHKKITFKNRYGITLVADMYAPKNATGALPAIAISGPFGAVKEQSSGIYAQELAEQGFVTLAFDGSYTGESGGEPRNIASPEINTEDFSAAVDYLSTLAEVNPERIGILGICGWGGFALNAAAADTRIKATATSTMYDITRLMAEGYYNSVDADGRYQMRTAINTQRTQDARNHQTSYAYDRALPAKLSGQEPQFVVDYWHYYKTPRGFHPRSVNSNAAWSTSTSLAMMNMPILQRAGEIRSPVLVVHGSAAHSLYFSQDAFKKLTGNNKELVIIEGANHVDLYDKQSGKIPFDKFTQFFQKHLQ